MLKSILAISVVTLGSSATFAQHSEQAAREFEIIARAEAEAASAQDGQFHFKVRGFDVGEGQMEKATFLGVGTSQAGETLSEQLNLPTGIGLTVDFVTKDAPAEKAGILQHDILHKFNDQLLCNEKQLATLVRMNKPGDTVKLTVIRKGQPMEITATLTERDMPKLEWSMSPEAMEDHVIKFNEHGSAFPGNFNFESAPRVMVFGGEGRSSITKHDKNRSISVNIDNGNRTVKVTEDGKVIFDGPFNTDEEKSKMDMEIRKEIEGLEQDVPDVKMDSDVEIELAEPTTQPST